MQYKVPSIDKKTSLFDEMVENGEKLQSTYFNQFLYFACCSSPLKKSMKRIALLLSLVLLIAVPSIAQDESGNIEELQKELEKAKAEEAIASEQSAAIQAQIDALTPPKKWHIGGYFGFIANQAAFVNWAAGGENSVSGTFTGGFHANYLYGKHSFESRIEGNLGYSKIGKDDFVKSQDNLNVDLKYGYDLGKKVFLTIPLQFATVFAVTEDVNNESPGFANLSMFAAPAFIMTGIGIDYKPNPMFSLYVSPATGKFTFVASAKDIDETRYGVMEGNKFRGEFGASLRAVFEREVAKNVNLWTSLNLFNNFTDPNKPNRKTIDVGWQTRLTLSVNDWLKASLFAHLFYDNDIKIAIFDEDGNPVPLINPDTGLPYLDENGDPIQKKGPRTQFRETFGISFIFSRNAL